MRRLAITGLIFLSLAACAAGQHEVSSAAPQPTAVPALSANEIAGRWDVVSFEGYEPAQRLSAFAHFRPDGVRLRIECNYSIVPGLVRDGRFATQPGLRMQTEMGCGQEREERDTRYFAFFDRLPTVERLTNGRLRLTAGESVLILERPEQRRLAYLPERGELDGSWRMESLTRYEAGGGESGIGLSDVPGHIIIQGNLLSYDRCRQYALDFTFGADGRLTKTGGASLPVEPNCPALTLPWPTTGLPTPDQVLPLLHSNPWVEEIGAGRLLISNDQLGLVVTKDE